MRGLSAFGEKAYMLVDKNHSDIFPLLREVHERFLDRRRLGFGIYHEEVSLRVWRVCDMLKREGYSVSIAPGFFIGGWVLTPIPARRSPVTELHRYSELASDIVEYR